MSADFFEKLRKIKGFCRILPDNQHPVQIKGASLFDLKYEEAEKAEEI